MHKNHDPCIADYLYWSSVVAVGGSNNFSALSPQLHSRQINNEDNNGGCRFRQKEIENVTSLYELEITKVSLQLQCDMNKHKEAA